MVDKNAIYDWNRLQSYHQNTILYQLIESNRIKLNKILTTFFLNRCN